MKTVSKNIRVGSQVVSSEKLLSNLQFEIKRLKRIKSSLLEKGLDHSHPLLKSYTDMIQKRVSIIESLLQEAA